MADPISGVGGAGKMLMKQMQQMQQQQQPQNQMKTKQMGGGASQFQKTLQANQTAKPEQIQQVAQAQKAQTNKVRSFRQMSGVNNTQRVNATNKTGASRLNKTNEASSTEKGIAKMLEKVSNEKAEVDKMVNQAMNGKTFNNKELLVLQHKMTGYSLKMDLTSKVVDKAVGGIKQAMNTQV